MNTRQISLAPLLLQRVGMAPEITTSYDSGWNRRMDYRDYIVTDPQICGGQPTFKGTRVLLRSVIGHLSAGDTAESILQAYSTLTPDHVRAAIAFAASSAIKDLPPPNPLPAQLREP